MRGGPPLNRTRSRGKRERLLIYFCVLRSFPSNFPSVRAATFGVQRLRLAVALASEASRSHKVPNKDRPKEIRRSPTPIILPFSQCGNDEKYRDGCASLRHKAQLIDFKVIHICQTLKWQTFKRAHSKRTRGMLDTASTGQQKCWEV